MKNLEKGYLAKLGYKNKKSLKPTTKSEIQDLRDVAYNMQAYRAQLWYNINSKMTLSYSLWNYFAKILFIIWLIAILSIEILFFWNNPGKTLCDFPFLWVSIFGFFGGGISAFTISRTFIETNTSNELIKMFTFTRMILGGCGAFIVYVIVGSGLVSSPFSDILQDNFLSLIAFGIVAGFSEQLFIETLNKASQNLKLVS